MKRSCYCWDDVLLWQSKDCITEYEGAMPDEAWWGVAITR